MRRRVPVIVACALFALNGCAGVVTPPKSTQQNFFNHAYTVVDPDTADAISKSPLLNAAADFQSKTVKASDGRTWFGRYVYFRQTYLEFFAPGDLLFDSAPSPVGTSGLALGGDRKGAAALLQLNLRGAGIQARSGMEQRQLGGAKVDWFTYVEFTPTASPALPRLPRFEVWGMEYAESYFSADPTKELAEGVDDAVSRERYLSDAYAQRLIRDVTAIEFGMAEEVYRTGLKPMLLASGYAVTDGASGARAIGRDDRISVRFVAPSRAGLRCVAFALNRPLPRQRRERIGSSVLALGPGRVGQWAFNGAQCRSR